jgi:hypothetical protein
LGYRFYRTHSSGDAITTNAVDLRVSKSLGRSIGLTAGVQHQWGSNLAADRMELGLSRSF